MSEIIERSPEERVLAPDASAPLPIKKKLLKGYLDVLAKVSPTAAGRRATDLFGYTRNFGKTPPKDVAPLGARRFPIKDVPGVTHGYLWGKAERTVLLVHGWGADSSSMYSFVRSLLKAGFQVAAFDAPAHGVSVGTLTTMTAFKNAVKGAILSLGDVYGIVAHSLGCIASTGALAELGATHTVEALVLVSPAATLPEVIQNWSKGFLKLTPAVVHAMHVELWKRNGVPVEHWNIGVLGRNLRAPILVLHDPRDPVVPICESEKIAEALPAVSLERIAKVGHVRILSDGQVVERIANFMGVHAAATPFATPAAS